MGFSALPKASGQQHVKTFKTLGWQERRRKAGSHIVLTHPRVGGVVLSVPDHREVALGTLKCLVRIAGLTDDQYRRAFDNC
jgi:predicted RNA binding protein YcfA (HicA-like mRNA interferase family)